MNYLVLSYLEEFFQKSLKEVGCTTPFGFNLDNICTDKNLGIKANKLYSKHFFNSHIKECLYPCHFLNVLLTPQWLRKNESGKIVFKFEEYIKVSTSSLAYTELELLAEVGGYVGLFMGLSIFDLRYVINRIFNLRNHP